MLCVTSIARPGIDPAFTALDLESMEALVLGRLQEVGVGYGCLRVHQTRQRTIHVRDREVEEAADSRRLGAGVRVLVDGAWGFAATSALTGKALLDATDRAVGMARLSRAFAGPPVLLADEPRATGTYVGGCRLDPFDVPMRDATDWLLTGTGGLLAHVAHARASLIAVRETTSYADLAGSRLRQQRCRIHPTFTAVTVGNPGFDDMSTTGPPTGRGWEYTRDDGWDWSAELAALPELLREKVAAPTVVPGRYDLVVDPTNLWLTIHESVGHATELDRALGYEANYAGTTFATPDQLGRLRYGSQLMTVRGDRTVDHGLATVGWDDEGVAAQEWDLVRDGALVGFQLDRQMAGPDRRSNGCAYADSADHVPIQRMPNVSLQPDPAGPDTADLIATVEDGLYVVGDKSWSIDMQRYNFQFTGQRFYRIRSGRLVGQVRDAAYQSDTLSFWNSLIALGGPQTYLLGGALNCGKGQPGQVAPVSHGCPSAVFSGVNILNTRAESGR